MAYQNVTFSLSFIFLARNRPHDMDSESESDSDDVPLQELVQRRVEPDVGDTILQGIASCSTSTPVRDRHPRSQDQSAAESICSSTGAVDQLFSDLHPPRHQAATRPPQYEEQDGCPENIVIGGEDATMALPRHKYNALRQRSASGKDMVVGLLPMGYSKEEISNFNYFGGSVHVSGEIVQKQAFIEDARFKAMLAQAEKEFPGCTSGAMAKEIRHAVNSKCRKITHRARVA